MTIVRCSFVNNSARHGGGAIAHLIGDDAKVVNCEFIENGAGVGSGGAIYSGHMFQSEGALISNSVFRSNISMSPGGAINVFTKMKIRNCAFIANVDGGISGNGDAAYGSFWGAGAIYVAGSGNVPIQGCTFRNNKTLAGSSATPFPKGNSILVKGVSARAEITNSIFWNDTSGESDLDGEARLIGGRVDMGCDEFSQ